MTKTPAKVTEMMNARTTAQLVEDFAATENVNDENIYTVRGWLMDALEARNADAFNNWIDGDASIESLKKHYAIA